MEFILSMIILSAIIFTLGVLYMTYDRLLLVWGTLVAKVKEKLLKKYVVMSDKGMFTYYAYSKNDCTVRHYRNMGSRYIIKGIERL